MPDYLKSAQDGSIEAIEILMNQSFGPKGVAAYVDKSGSTLKVTLRTINDGGPNKRFAELAKAGLTKINPKGFDNVLVTAESMRTKTAVWSTRWKLSRLGQKTLPQAAQPSRKAKNLKLEATPGDWRWKITLALLGIAAGLVLSAWWLIAAKTSNPSAAPAAPEAKTGSTKTPQHQEAPAR